MEDNKRKPFDITTVVIILFGLLMWHFFLRLLKHFNVKPTTLFVWLIVTSYALVIALYIINGIMTGDWSLGERP